MAEQGASTSTLADAMIKKVVTIIEQFNVANVNQTFNEDCVICLEGFDDCENSDIINIACGHKFHHECIGGFVVSQLQSNSNITCPVCRLSVMDNKHELYVDARSLIVQPITPRNDNENEPLTVQEHTRIVCIVLARVLVLLLIFAICVALVGLLLFFIL